VHNGQRDPHIATVDQHIGQASYRTGDRWAKPIIGTTAKSVRDVGRRCHCAASGEGINPAISAAMSYTAGQEAPKSVSKVTDQVCCNSFDIPARAKARYGQLPGVQTLNQCGDLAALGGNRLKDTVAVR
jgi:hypothetical protein